MAAPPFAVQSCAQEEPPKTKKIRATLFFDGTLNNKTNTEIGMARAKDPAKHQGDVGTSYGNYYTNVALLYQNIDSDKLNGYDSYLPLYIEGIGTTDKAGDSTMGYAFGSMGTGVAAKVDKGLRLLMNHIRKFINRDINSGKKNTRIEELRLDVYGFSRGAAAARHFVHRALNTSYIPAGDTLITLHPIKTMLEQEGFKVGTVKVYFVGIYDTVSSLGLSGTAMGLSNVNELGLDAISAADSVYHLAALDEHRANFALTNIKSAGGKGKEILLPGVHSDIGGSYNTREVENIQIYDTDVPYITYNKYVSI
ncbi:T6SS phospholipase effector Tle1-like catalytic domain-containing protein, partial [Archangium violaceum]